MSRIMWALAFGILLVAGQSDAGERPFRETARVALPRAWQAPAELVGDSDVATTQIWISQDGNVNAGSSWSTGEDPSLWGATDLVLVDGVASQVSMTSGLDQNAVTFERMDVLESYTGDLGLPGTPLYFGVVNLISMRGPGTLHYRSVSIRLHVASSNHLNAVSLPGPGIIGGLYVEEGKVDVGADTSFAAGGATLATLGPYGVVTVAGSASTAPHSVHCLEGTMDLGLRGPAAANGTISVAGGHLKLHKLTGAQNYLYLIQTGGRIDFDILEANGTNINLQLAGGVADFRKCQYAFDTLGALSYIGPAAQIIPGRATTEAILLSSGIDDLR